MKLGILFPVVIFIVAVVFLGWFFVGGYAAPGGGHDEKDNHHYDYCRYRGGRRHRIGLVVISNFPAAPVLRSCLIYSIS